MGILCKFLMRFDQSRWHKGQLARGRRGHRLLIDVKIFSFGSIVIPNDIIIKCAPFGAFDPYTTTLCFRCIPVKCIVNHGESRTINIDTPTRVIACVLSK